MTIPCEAALELATLVSLIDRGFCGRSHNVLRLHGTQKRVALCAARLRVCLWFRLDALHRIRRLAKSKVTKIGPWEANNAMEVLSSCDRIHVFRSSPSCEHVMVSNTNTNSSVVPKGVDRSFLRFCNRNHMNSWRLSAPLEWKLKGSGSSPGHMQKS